MKRTVEEFAAAFDEWAETYDEENDFEDRYVMESLVVEYAAPTPTDTVVDLGTGTGAVALALADEARTVIGRDISEGMLEQARRKAAERGLTNVDFGVGRFRDPHVTEADIVVTNLALHHLGDPEKRDAIETIAGLGPRRLVFGESMFFDDPDPDDPLFNPESVYPATVEDMREMVTDAGFVATTVEQVNREAGVLVAERSSEDP